MAFRRSGPARDPLPNPAVLEIKAASLRATAARRTRAPGVRPRGRPVVRRDGPDTEPLVVNRLADCCSQNCALSPLTSRINFMAWVHEWIVAYIFGSSRS